LAVLLRDGGRLELVAQRYLAAASSMALGRKLTLTGIVFFRRGERCDHESAQRLKIVDALYRSAWNLIEMNVRSSHPDWDEPQVRAAVAARIAGGTN